MRLAAAHNCPLVCGWSHAVTPSTLLLRGSETALVCLPLLWPHGDLAHVHEGLIFIRLDELHALLRPRGWLLHVKCICMLCSAFFFFFFFPGEESPTCEQVLSRAITVLALNSAAWHWLG